jgi:hypothetical protein
MRQRGMFGKDNAQRSPIASLSDEELLRKIALIFERLGVPVPHMRLPRRS